MAPDEELLDEEELLLEDELELLDDELELLDDELELLDDELELLEDELELEPLVDAVPPQATKVPNNVDSTIRRENGNAEKEWTSTMMSTR
jgi:hypothetical protein